MVAAVSKVLRLARRTEMRGVVVSSVRIKQTADKRNHKPDYNNDKNNSQYPANATSMLNGVSFAVLLISTVTVSICAAV